MDEPLRAGDLVVWVVAWEAADILKLCQYDLQVLAEVSLLQPDPVLVVVSVADLEDHPVEADSEEASVGATDQISEVDEEE